MPATSCTRTAHAPCCAHSTLNTAVGSSRSATAAPGASSSPRNRLREAPTTATDHPRDGHWVQVVLRWMLNRPVLLSVAFVVFVGGIMATMMFVGPPGGRA